MLLAPTILKLLFSEKAQDWIFEEVPLSCSWTFFGVLAMVSATITLLYISDAIAERIPITNQIAIMSLRAQIFWFVGIEI